jgi:hypothetical protein
MSSHVANAGGFDLSALFKSAGTPCTTPLDIFLCDMDMLWPGIREGSSAQECSPPGVKCPQWRRLGAGSVRSWPTFAIPQVCRLSAGASVMPGVRRPLLPARDSSARLAVYPPGGATLTWRRDTICRVDQASSSRDPGVLHRCRRGLPAILALRARATGGDACCR